jgi:glutamine amidotransferase
MCRFAAYIGPEIFVSSLVTEPKHSIIHQSYHAKERTEPLNGDGFGIGWYAPQFCNSPAVFKEVSPAWSNQNLQDISRVTKSNCIFAHVRAATIGGQLSRTNCHPFSWKKYLFMHNGTIFGFGKIRRLLRRDLSDEAYDLIKGNTDTEHIFALFVDLIKHEENPTVEQLVNALSRTISKIEELKAQVGIETPSTMNLVLSDGQRMVTTRYISKGEKSNSLYIITGSEFCTEGDQCRMNEGNDAVLIVSEPLNNSSRWQKIANNHIITVDQDKKISDHKM